MAFRLLVSAGLMALAAAGVRGQAPEAAANAPVNALQTNPAPSVAPDLNSLVANLDSPEVQVRIDATEALFQSGSITLKQIEAVLRTATLSLEQRQRLLGVAYRRFRTEPRAAMGIQNDGNLGSHGITLAILQAGFPAAQVLRLGDRVIGAGGVTIDSWETMRAVIVSHDPGDEIPVTVVREGATLNLTVELGDFGKLPKTSTLDGAILSDAWRMRSRDLQDPELSKATPIESGLPAAAWTTQFLATADDLADIGAIQQGPEGAVTLVAGGEPRGGLQGPVNPPMVQRGFNVRIQGERRGQFAQPQAVPLAQDQIIQQQMLMLLSRLQDERALIDTLNQRIADPTLQAPERQALRAKIDAASTRVQMLNDQIQRLNLQLLPRRVR